MKISLILTMIYFVMAFSVEARVLMREVEGEAPIEVVAPPPVVIDEVKEYSYEGESPTNAEFSVIEKGIKSLEKVNKEKVVNTKKTTTQEIANANDPMKKEGEEEVTFVPVAIEQSPKVTQNFIREVIIDDSYYVNSKGQLTFSLSLGVSDTAYDQLDSKLERGAFRSQFILNKFISVKESVGASLSFYHPGDKDLVVENTSMSVFKLFYLRQHFLSTNVYLIGGAGVNFADFNIRKTVYENNNLITYKKILEGFAIGVTPEIGVRYTFKDDMSFDLTMDYSFFFGEERSNLGGFSIAPRFNISY